MSIKGIGGKRQHDHLKECKAIAQVAGWVVLPDIKIRRPRKDKGMTRGKYNQLEAQLRKIVIKWLKKRGAKVWRIETAINHQLGLPDILFFINKEMYWCELKSETGMLSKEQLLFEHLCCSSGINHIIARSIEDIKIILDK